jgi:hypothetical protein
MTVRIPVCLFLLILGAVFLGSAIRLAHLYDAVETRLIAYTNATLEANTPAAE